MKEYRSFINLFPYVFSALLLSKCLKQITYPRSFQTCAPIPKVYKYVDSLWKVYIIYLYLKWQMICYKGTQIKHYKVEFIKISSSLHKNIYLKHRYRHLFLCMTKKEFKPLRTTLSLVTLRTGGGCRSATPPLPLRFSWKLVGRILYMHICYH